MPLVLLMLMTFSSIGARIATDDVTEAVEEDLVGAQYVPGLKQKEWYRLFTAMLIILAMRS